MYRETISKIKLVTFGAKLLGLSIGPPFGGALAQKADVFSVLCICLSECRGDKQNSSSSARPVRPVDQAKKTKRRNATENRKTPFLVFIEEGISLPQPSFRVRQTVRAMFPKEISVDEGLMIMEEAIVKARRIIQGESDLKFTTEEYFRFYECVYFMCVNPNNYGKTNEIYDRFKESLEESIVSTVLPSLANKSGAPLLTELVVMWCNYKKMSKRLIGFFQYLDRFFIPHSAKVLSLNDTCINCFQELVFEKLVHEFCTAAISLINQEREGSHIDWNVLKNALLIFVEIDGCGRSRYYQEFEKAMLEEAANYYSRLAEGWLLYDSCADYIQKVKWCINREKERASCCFPCCTGEKLLKVVIAQLVENRVARLNEKQQAENCGLFTDFQEMLSKCAGMRLEEGSPTSTPGEWLSSLMENSAHINGV
ncbi:cullin-1-like [Tripterygium wilfordii]|nr:cullin-1-like [Tripterygium wilfordii]